VASARPKPLDAPVMIATAMGRLLRVDDPFKQ
jgi:hypothetical protein